MMMEPVEIITNPTKLNTHMTLNIAKSLSDNCVKNILDIVLNEDVIDFEDMVNKYINGKFRYDLSVSTSSAGFKHDELENNIKYTAESLAIRHSQNLVDNIVIQLTNAVNKKSLFEFSLVENGIKNLNKINFTAIKYKPTNHGHNISLNYISFILCDELNTVLELMFDNTEQLN